MSLVFIRTSPFFLTVIQFSNKAYLNCWPNRLRIFFGCESYSNSSWLNLKVNHRILYFLLKMNVYILFRISTYSCEIDNSPVSSPRKSNQQLFVNCSFETTILAAVTTNNRVVVFLSWHNQMYFVESLEKNNVSFLKWIVWSHQSSILQLETFF